MDKPVVIKAHFSFIGEAVGVKENQGIIEHIMREIEIECLPSDIPEHIEVDVSALKIGDSIHVKDLTVPEGIEIYPESSIFIIEVKVNSLLKFL